MPFSRHEGAVAGSLEYLGDGDTALRPSPADLLGVKPGQQRRPRGCTQGIVVKLGEAKAV